MEALLVLSEIKNCAALVLVELTMLSFIRLSEKYMCMILSAFVMHSGNSPINKIYNNALYSSTPVNKKDTSKTDVFYKR